LRENPARTSHRAERTGMDGMKLPGWFFWVASLTMGVAGYALAAVVAANPY